MADESNSWIRRTKFSHTVCHRLDSSRLASLPFALRERTAGLKSRPGAPSPHQKSVPGDAQVQLNPTTGFRQKSVPSGAQVQLKPTTNRLRSLSPLPETPLPDTFKEARHATRRFSTPVPRRKESDKGLMGKLSHKQSRHETRSSSISHSTSPLKHLGSLRVGDRYKGRKESAWTKYFDHGGGRVNAVDASDEHSVDLSQLFLGLRFAHGAHSRLYHGIYKDEPVAVKIIRVPDDDENGTLAARLEKQFNREVTLLSRLHHPNVIKVTKFLLLPFHLFSVIQVFSFSR